MFPFDTSGVLFVTFDAVQFETCGCRRSGGHGMIGADGRRRRRRRRRLGLAFARLDAVLAHGQRSVDAVQLVVQSARVAHGFALGVATPQRRRRRAAVGAAQAQPSRRALHQFILIRLSIIPPACVIRYFVVLNLN